MAPYIGTPTSRVDGHAKVTGAAKYAGEFSAAGLAHGTVIGAYSSGSGAGAEATSPRGWGAAR